MIAISAVSALVCGSVAHAANFTLNFDFTRTSGDRDYYFGTHQTNNLFDSNTDRTYFQVTSSNGGVLDAYSSGSAWLVLDDNAPATVGGSSNAYVAGSSLVMRTRIFYLTSATNGEAAATGFAFGLTDSSGTSNGFLALVQSKTNGSNDDSLMLRNLTAGQAGTAVNTGGNFNYGSSSNIYFLQLVLTPAGASVNYTLSLFADSAISGTGVDNTRMTSGDFSTATPVAQLSGTLEGYTGGYVGMYFQDNSTGAPTNPSKGGADFTNFYINNNADSAVPEPAALSVLGIGALACLLKRR